MKDKRSLAATRKSDIKGEGLGDIDALLGHKLTAFQKNQQERIMQENLHSDDDFEEIDLEQLADENYMAKRKQQLKQDFQSLSKKVLKK